MKMKEVLSELQEGAIKDERTSTVYLQVRYKPEVCKEALLLVQLFSLLPVLIGLG